MPTTDRSWKKGRAVALVALALLAQSGHAFAQWGTREAGGVPEAGTLVEGRYAGLLLRCPAPGRLQLVLTHNGAVFDKGREHTLSLSVDGVATLLPARALEGGANGDDFVHEGTPASLDPLLRALARGREVEISAPSGRYTLALAGSSRALGALRESCGTP